MRPGLLSGPLMSEPQDDRLVGRCAICGEEVDNPAQRFCGGDRCLRVRWLI